MKAYIKPIVKENEVAMQQMIAISQIGYSDDSADNTKEVLGNGHRSGDFWGDVWNDENE